MYCETFVIARVGKNTRIYTCERERNLKVGIMNNVECLGNITIDSHILSTIMGKWERS